MNFEELEEMADDIRSTPHSSVARECCLEMFDLIEKMHDELFTLHIENKNLRGKILYRKNRLKDLTPEAIEAINKAKEPDND